MGAGSYVVSSILHTGLLGGTSSVFHSLRFLLPGTSTPTRITNTKTPDGAAKCTVFPVPSQVHRHSHTIAVHHQRWRQPTTQNLQIAHVGQTATLALVRTLLRRR